MQPFCVIRFPSLGESLSADGANHDISLQKVKALTPLFQVCEIGINLYPSADGANHDISLQKVKASTILLRVCEIGINPDILEFGELPESEIAEVNLLNNCPIIRHISMFIRF